MTISVKARIEGILRIYQKDSELHRLHVSPVNLCSHFPRRFQNLTLSCIHHALQFAFTRCYTLQDQIHIFPSVCVPLSEASSSLWCHVGNCAQTSSLCTSRLTPLGATSRFSHRSFTTLVYPFLSSHTALSSQTKTRQTFLRVAALKVYIIYFQTHKSIVPNSADQARKKTFFPQREHSDS